MITITPKSVWMVELTDFFVDRFGYQMLQVMEDRENTWLFNVANTVYPIVYLTTQEVSASASNSAMRDGVHLEILQRTHSSGGRLEICVGSIGPMEEFPEGRRIGLFPGGNVPKEILDVFPGLDKALQGVNGQNLQKRYVSAHNKLRNDHRDRLLPPVRNALNPKREKENRTPYATYWMMGICAVMFAVSWLLARRFSSVYDSTTVAVFMGAYYKAMILGMHQWWRLLTAVFLHVEPLHLLSNLLSLYLVGTFVERSYGHLVTALIVTVSGIAGNVFYIAAGPNSVSCGISGGIYGLLGALMIYYIHSGLWKIPRLRNSFLMMLGLNIFISFMPGISWMAHLGGFLMGVLISFILVKNAKWKSMRPHMIAAGCILWAGIVYLCWKTGIDKVYFGTDQAVAGMADSMGLSSYAQRIITEMVSYYHSIGF